MDYWIKNIYLERKDKKTSICHSPRIGEAWSDDCGIITMEFEKQPVIGNSVVALVPKEIPEDLQDEVCWQKSREEHERLQKTKTNKWKNGSKEPFYK